jgi:hypothetical protein
MMTKIKKSSFSVIRPDGTFGLPGALGAGPAQIAAPAVVNTKQHAMAPVENI